MRIALRSVLPLLLAALALAGCARKEIGELCKDDDECETKDCVVLGFPGAEGASQCSSPCGDGCPDGSVCIAGTDCARACGSNTDCPDDTACHPSLGACFVACTSDDQCGNNACSGASRLCE
ncbi:MAG TPA: hypothetical protein PKW35_00865 [Nannocystaceae bacterium]|nr:hypothetical protein [Nannocystaceae bacterium]